MTNRVRSLLIIGLAVQFIFLGSVVTFGNAAAVESLDKETDRVYDVPGSYGTQRIEVIKGNVLIDSPGVTLRNMVVEGTLTVSDKVRTGAVLLEGVSIAAEAKLIAGGNSRVTFTDTWVKKLSVVGTDQITVEATGASHIETLFLNASAHVLESNLNGLGFVDVSTEAEARIKLSQVGLRRLTITKNLCTLDVLSGSVVDELRINAPLGRGYLDANSVIKMCKFNRPAKMEGEGAILAASVNTANVQMVYPPESVEIKAGVSKPTYTRAYVEAFRPAADTYDIGLNPDISVAFSNAVKLFQPKVALMLNLRENGGNGPSVTLLASGSTSGGRTTVSAKPLMSLRPGHVYALELENVTDMNDLPVLGKKNVLFRTQTVDKPVVVQVSPSHLAQDVSIGAEVEVRFSKIVRRIDNAPLDEGNVNTALLLRRGSLNSPPEPYSAEIFEDVGQTRIKLLTDYYLTPNTEYFLSIEGLEDSLDQPLEGRKTFSFKTAAASSHAVITGFSHKPVFHMGQKKTKMVVVVSEKVRMSDEQPITDENLQELIVLREGGPEGHRIPFSGQVEHSNGAMIITIMSVAELNPGNTYHYSLGDMVDDKYMDVMGPRVFSFIAE